jgi:hypothetical protein
MLRCVFWRSMIHLHALPGTILHRRCFSDSKVRVHCSLPHWVQPPASIHSRIQGSDPETINTGTIESRYKDIVLHKTLLLGGKHRITFDMDRDMYCVYQIVRIFFLNGLARLWRWDQVLKTHPNGMRFSAFDEDGGLLATNEYFRWVVS